MTKSELRVEVTRAVVIEPLAYCASEVLQAHLRVVIIHRSSELLHSAIGSIWVRMAALEGGDVIS